jgi:hypothetical protein
MIWTWKESRTMDHADFHRVFLWWPTRVSPTKIVWLSIVGRRLIIDDEGNWAGGQQSHWEYTI